MALVSLSVSDKLSKLTDIETKEDLTDHQEPQLDETKKLRSSLKNIKVHPKKKENRSKPKARVCRFDRLGNEIGKSKQRVTFVDEVTTKKLAVVHIVPSFKQHNVLTVKTGSGNCTWSIF